jgi:two-component system sensor histidine kinase MprB
MGIQEKDRETLFDTFSRNRDSKNIPGSGLGLAIVREATARHGGRAWLDSVSGQGTTVFISIRKDLGRGSESNGLEASQKTGVPAG